MRYTYLFIKIGIKNNRFRVIIHSGFLQIRLVSMHINLLITGCKFVINDAFKQSWQKICLLINGYN